MKIEVDENKARNTLLKHVRLLSLGNILTSVKAHRHTLIENILVVLVKTKIDQFFRHICRITGF